MTPLVDHSAADVVASLIVSLGLGSARTSPPFSAWPVGVASEPDAPDELITVYDTAGNTQGRVMRTGEYAEAHGVQIRVRSLTHKRGMQKARQVSLALESKAQVYLSGVSLDGTLYVVHALSRRGTVNALGHGPGNKLVVCTLNYLVNAYKDG